jgi:hypothetical protein
VVPYDWEADPDDVEWLSDGDENAWLTLFTVVALAALVILFVTTL